MNILSILGPTAAGKSAVAQMVAQKTAGEIISCDSMLVYRGMDIGTAKPTVDERRHVPYHLIDIREIHQPFTVKDFTQLAKSALSDIYNRRQISILCGGTGLYAKALLYDYKFLPHDEEVAQIVREEFRQGKRESLLRELEEIDPVWARDVKQNDNRLLRAIEVVRITHQPRSSLIGDPARAQYDGPQWILLPDATTSRRRIRNRVEQMFENGWVTETKRLVKAGLLETVTAGKALGYAEVAAYLRGEIDSLSKLIDKITLLTSRYAKRQRTWFTNQHPHAIKIEVKIDTNAVEIADRIIRESL